MNIGVSFDFNDVSMFYFPTGVCFKSHLIYKMLLNHWLAVNDADIAAEVCRYTAFCVLLGLMKSAPAIYPGGLLCTAIVEHLNQLMFIFEVVQARMTNLP